MAVVWMAALGRREWALALLIGGGLSVFSLFTLTVAVPFLFRPGASRTVRTLLGITLAMKLPVYCAGLYFGTRLSHSSVAFLIAGIGLAPANITLRALPVRQRRARALARGRERAATALVERVTEGA